MFVLSLFLVSLASRHVSARLTPRAVCLDLAAFLFWLGHCTLKLFLTFLLILRVGCNSSNRGYSEWGGASPGNSLPLAEGITRVFSTCVYGELFLLD